MADIHPLNDGWPEKLPYEQQSLILPGPGKPGHSGTSTSRVQGHLNSQKTILSVEIYRNGESPYLRITL